MLQRCLEPETLDHLAPDDPAAQRSRRDLRRVNRVMGARGILVRALSRARPAPPDRPLRVVELGCGDGLLMLDVARHWPGAGRAAHLTLLDRQPIVTAATLDAYRRAGWHAETLGADVLEWAADASASAHWDIAVANLFLHHFEGAALE